jgi:hypothetical protein
MFCVHLPRGAQSGSDVKGIITVGFSPHFPLTDTGVGPTTLTTFSLAALLQETKRQQTKIAQHSPHPIPPQTTAFKSLIGVQITN